MNPSKPACFDPLPQWEKTMKQIDNKMITDTKTIARKILDFLIGCLGSLIVANIAIVLIAEFNTPELMWISIFTWVWRFGLVGLAVFFPTGQRIWISIGLMAALLTQASDIYLGLAGLAIMLLITKRIWISMPL
jgi:hypothetical protein